MSKRIFLIVAVISAFAVIAACSSTGSDASDEDVISDMLARIPDTESTRQWLYVADFEVARELGGIETPDTVNEETFLQYLGALEGIESEIYVGLPGWISAYGDDPQEFFKFREVLGYDLTKVSAGVTVGSATSRYEVAAVDYDPAETINRIKSCSECPQPEELEFRGETFFRWDNDPNLLNFSHRFSPPLLDSFGRGGNVWFDDRLIHRAALTDNLRGMIAVRDGAVPSLADNEAVARLHAIMRSVNGYSYVFSDQPLDIEFALPWDPENPLKDFDYMLAELRPLRSYSAYAVGSAMEEDGTPFIALTVLCDSEEDATHNADQLRHNLGTERFFATDEPFSDYFTSFDVSAEGDVVIARLFTEGSPQSWAMMLNYNLYPQLIGTE